MHPQTMIKKIIDKGIFGNRWFWFHSMGGAVGAKIFLLFGMDKVPSFALVALIAVLWEILELCGDKFHPEEVYGSWERWAYDAFMDIVGAVFMAGVVVL